MGLFNWFRRRAQPPATTPGDQFIVKNVPALTEPILLFTEIPAFVTAFAGVPSWQVVHVKSFEEFKAAIDDCLGKMATDHKQDAATLFVHQFQQFEDVPVLAA
jgi:hypothetical protein